MNRLLMSLLLLVCANAHADVFRCKVNGKTAYQDKPCAGKTREDSRAVLPPISVVGAPQAPADAAAAAAATGVPALVSATPPAAPGATPAPPPAPAEPSAPPPNASH